MKSVRKTIVQNYFDEAFDEELYRILAKIEKNQTVRNTLLELSQMEKKHKEFWLSVAEEKGFMLKRNKIKRLKIWFYVLLRRILGVYLMSKVLERKEWKDVNKYLRLGNFIKDEEKRGKLFEIAIEESRHEEMIASTEVNSKNVSDFIYGISDGLIEVLASVSGLAGLFVLPLYVALGGLIVGLSGTMSMSIGAYLSTESEKDLDREGVSPSKSALVTGSSYITGAIIPIIPFLLNIHGFVGLIFAYTLSGTFTFIIGYLIGLISGNNPYKKGLKMLILAISAAIATHLLGISISVLIHMNLI